MMTTPALAGLPTISPMLATAGLVPHGDGWGFEFKYDGARALSYLEDGRVRVLSRNNNDTTGSFPELAELAGLLPARRAVVDGEIVALEAGDRPSFARLQQRLHAATAVSPRAGSEAMAAASDNGPL
jgi:bifunctional non-homologous end joining protein LigD